MSWLFFVIAALCVKNAAVTAFNPYRLPKSVIPYHYNLFLAPDIYNKTPEKFYLTGNVEIYAKVNSPTNNVTLHSKNLTIANVYIMKNGKNIFKSEKYDEDKQWFVFSLKESLVKGDEIRIKIDKFERPILHTLYGLYYYTEKTKGKPRRYGVTTQMEPTYARHMFPCFDEPALKARFKISVLRKEPHYSISNAQLDHQETTKKPGWIIDHFKKTPIMSTYLTAVVVTEYEGISEMHRNVNFTIYYPEGRKKNVQLAMTIARRVFEKLEDYFQVRFPIPKLDQIGFRSRDYMFGGMENYGLITYAQQYLYQQGNQKLYDRYIAGVVLHEITHQWFGNLVTMKWWDDLWLNEGMTEFFTFQRGKWIEDYDPLITGNRQVLSAMTLELNRLMTPVYVPWAKSPAEVLSMVNSVTYVKGGMLLRMAEQIMGEDVFRDAMRSYVRAHKFGSVTHSDLWKAFTTTNEKHGNGLDMAKILSPWLKQPGYPVVNVSIDYEGRTIKYEQEVFGKTMKEYDAGMPKPSPYKYVWPLPIQWKTGNRGNSEIRVEYKKKGTVRVNERLYSSDWLVVNPEVKFYYIVSYEKQHWRKLGKHLRKDYMAIDQFTRGKLIFDAYNLYMATKSGRGDYMDAETLDAFLKFVEVEKDEFPLNCFKRIATPADKVLKKITTILKGRKLR